MLRFLLIFVVLSTLTAVSISFLGWQFGTQDYWRVHGVLLLFFLTFFPRLTLLFSAIPFGGFFWWLGFIVCPHYLVAILATLNYWSTNPILVTISWLVALGGESTEKYYIHRRVYANGEVIDVEAKAVSKKNSSPHS